MSAAGGLSCSLVACFLDVAPCGEAFGGGLPFPDRRDGQLGGLRVTDYTYLVRAGHRRRVRLSNLTRRPISARAHEVDLSDIAAVFGGAQLRFKLPAGPAQWFGSEIKNTRRLRTVCRASDGPPLG